VTEEDRAVKAEKVFQKEQKSNRQRLEELNVDAGIREYNDLAKPLGEDIIVANKMTFAEFEEAMEEVFKSEEHTDDSNN
jgi:hypothetical protein